MCVHLCVCASVYVVYVCVRVCVCLGETRTVESQERIVSTGFVQCDGFPRALMENPKSSHEICLREAVTSLVQ